MIEPFNQEYNKLSIKFLDASLREQILILLCGLFVVILLMFVLLLEPVINNIDKLQRNNTSAKNQITILAGQVAQLHDQLTIDPNDKIREKLDALKQQIQSIDEQLEALTGNLVPANKMAGMLEKVLANSKGLKLIELQSIAPKPMSLYQPEEGKEPIASLYRHGVKLIFEGSYFDIQRYLEKLESLPWQFYWKKFDYRVGEYPSSSVVLEIYTLSTTKDFIGV